MRYFVKAVALLLLGQISRTPPCALARVLRVPTEHSTIQAAFDAVATNDTVLVDEGLYAEALIAPRDWFFFLGNVEIDTGDFARPIVDASLTADSIHRGCLILPYGSDVTVEKIRFRNLFDMRPRTFYGGVQLFADTATFRFCAFDSTAHSVWHSEDSSANVRLENCLFRGGFGPLVWLASGQLVATHCHFSGGIGLGQVVCGALSQVSHCAFEYPWMSFLLTWGRPADVIGCVFGPASDLAFSSIVLDQFFGTFAQNLFIGVVNSEALLEISAKCDEVMLVSHNTVERCHPTTRTGGPPLIWASCGTNGRNPMLFDHNVIAACTVTTVTKAMHLEGQGEFTRNRFNDLVGTGRTVLVDSGSFEFSENLFIRTGIALQTAHDSVDARFNYWGHETGPYHPVLNPDGQGDEVGDNILFDPWYADTTFLNVPDPRPPLPTQYGLSVFPNPFNSQTRFRMELLEAGIYEIELFDILGRRASQVFKGPAAYRYELNFDASQLSAGVYFARLRDVIMNRPLATAKLMVIR